MNYLLLFNLFMFLNINPIVSVRLPQPAIINKCCRIGEQLVQIPNSTEESFKCTIGGSDNWYPIIYLIGRKIFMKDGQAPAHLKTNEAVYPKCSNPEFISGQDKVVIFSNGSLYVRETSTFIDNENYCAERSSALVCYPNSDQIGELTNLKKSKIQKCCGRQSAYDSQKLTCQSLKADHKFSQGKLIDLPNVDIIYGFPACDVHDYAIAGKFNIDNFEDATGVLTLDTGKQLQRTEYCIENTLDDVVNVFSCPNHFTSPDLAAPVAQDDIRFALYAIVLLISVIFLIATLAAGFLVPSNHHVLHWRCQTHYVTCLLIGDFLLAVTQISGNAISGFCCIAIAIMMHFFFLAAFFWLNTMCFNIWWTFRDFRPTSLEKGQELFRLRIYELYAWGSPLIIAGLAIIFDNLPDERFVRPRFGENKCWFYGDVEILIYFFGPIGVLLCINLFLFASTARQLTCGLWKRDDVKSTTERAALGRVCLKLVVVMGVTWCADIISWAVGGSNYLWYLWIVTDLVNALQGVFIFIVVGCQPQVWSAVKRIWTSKMGRGGMSTITNGPQHSSSSHGLPSMGESVTNNTFTNTSTKVPMETIC